MNKKIVSAIFVIAIIVSIIGIWFLKNKSLEKDDTFTNENQMNVADKKDIGNEQQQNTQESSTRNR